MLKKAYLILPMLCLALAGWSQTLESFETKSPGTIYLSPTDSVSGEIEYNALQSSKIFLFDGKNRTKFIAKEVLGFRLSNPDRNYIAVDAKKADGWAFYQVLTPMTARMHLLRYFVAEATVLGLKIQGGQVVGKWNTSMYSVAQKQLLSGNFKKVAEAVKDCPALSEKIVRKEKGYHYGLMSLPGVQENVDTRIATEYNACR